MSDEITIVEDEPKPTFDFTKVSRQWSKSFSESVQKATKVQIALERPKPQTTDYTTLQIYYDTLDKAADESTLAADEQAKLIAQVLIDVPREWLLATAPDVIDWSDEKNLDFIQEPRYVEILQMIQSGEARTIAKN